MSTPSLPSPSRAVELDRYRAAVGREPRNLPVDHPDAWQWAYAGTRSERTVLLMRLAGREVEGETVSQGELEI